MGKKDPFWKYVEPLGNRFICKFCQRNFSGGAPRIKSHLSGVTGRDIDICTKVPDDVQAKAFLSIGGTNKKTKIESTSENDDSAIPHAHSKFRALKPSTIPAIFKKKDKDAVDKLVAKYFIQNNIAFNIIQTPAFRNLIHEVAEFGPGYKLPSYSTLRTKLIPDSRKDIDEYISVVKKFWVNTGCSLMSDIWSDIKQRAFINIIVYSPGGAVFTNSFEISKDKKMETYLKNIVCSVIDEIGPKHVVQFITDNASNFESAGDMIIGKYPHMYKTRCAAHGIQLLLKDIHAQVEWIRMVIDNAKLIVTYMYRHTIVLSLMREHTNNKELKRPCETRFASNFLMLQSVVDVENELRIFIASPIWRGLEYNKQEMAKKVTHIIQSAEFWTEAKEVLQALEPLVRVLRLVDDEGSTSGYLYEAMERAKVAIRKNCQTNMTRYIQVWKLFEERRNANIIHPIHATAAFLNPAYMCSEDFVEDREMKQGLNFMFENIVTREDKHEFLKQVQHYR